MLDLLPFFQYINTMRGEMTIGDRRKCFFLMFLMRGKMKLGAAGSLMGDEHRGHLSHSLWHFSHLTCWNNHNLIRTLSHSAPSPRRSSLIFQISTSRLFDLLMETSNFARCQFAVACLSSALHILPKTFNLECTDLIDSSSESCVTEAFECSNRWFGCVKVSLRVMGNTLQRVKPVV